MGEQVVFLRRIAHRFPEISMN